MLTGYNTDIKHQGTIFHIQTEDGGESNPVIISLVYQGGRILASKKTSYAQIVGTDDFLAQLRTMLEDQHRAMIKAVKDGGLQARSEPVDIPSSTGMAAQPTELNPPASETGKKDGAPSPTVEEAKTLKEKNLDQVILEYLASEMDEE